MKNSFFISHLLIIMIAILDNVINALALQVGFMLGDMIRLLLTPVGAVMAVSLLAYLGHVTIKSITKDMQGVLIYLKNHKLKNAFFAPFQSTILPIILKKKNSAIKGIPSIIGIPLADT